MNFEVGHKTKQISQTYRYIINDRYHDIDFDRPDMSHRYEKFMLEIIEDFFLDRQIILGIWNLVHLFRKEESSTTDAVDMAICNICAPQCQVSQKKLSISC